MQNSHVRVVVDGKLFYFKKLKTSSKNNKKFHANTVHMDIAF